MWYVHGMCVVCMYVGDMWEGQRICDWYVCMCSVYVENVIGHVPNVL